eukprot:GHVO01059243.1.p1 GENE.GHVO01059243.1~~GHVO01059243.1.p1  ORF type:complete len:106 (+),score=9.10 GHVO01059243.1:65-382(+)
MLSDSTVRDTLTTELSSNLQSILPSDKVEEHWSKLRDAIYSTALQVHGTPKRCHQDWFDESDPAIEQLLQEKRALHKALLSDPTSTTKSAALRTVKADCNETFAK